MSVTSELVDWVVNASSDRFDAPALERARAAIVDTVGVILAGAHEEVTAIARAAVEEDGGAPIARHLGTELRCPPEQAALLNAIAGHALDFDDVNRTEVGHPSVVVLPAALAACELAGAGGRRLLEAYIIGVEVACKLGLVMGYEHYRRGWHATTTMGTLGAAMAAGKVLGLDRDGLASALGIAASEASGSRQNFGTMTKPFQVGHAAACGVRAARLAARGLTAHREILDAELGYFALFSFGEAEPDRLPGVLGKPLEIVDPGLNMKKYPCCFATHRAIDATLMLTAAHAVSPSGVRQVRVTVPPGGLDPLLHRRPASGLQAKFSMEYAVATSLLEGAPAPRHFEDRAVARPEVQHLVRLVEPHEDPAIHVRDNPMEEGHVEVALELTDGTVLTQTVRAPRGGPGLPLTAEEVAAKFLGCAAEILPGERAADALRRLTSIDGEHDIRSLTAALTPATADDRG